MFHVEHFFRPSSFIYRLVRYKNVPRGTFGKATGPGIYSRALICSGVKPETSLIACTPMPAFSIFRTISRLA